MRNLAIIPARSGSKGLVDKNIRNLGGKPLLAHTVDAARESGLFCEIMVSTDSIKYAEIAKQCGANVPFLRSEELSNDTASSWDAVREVLENYKNIGKTFDTVALLQPTSPLRTASDIIHGYEVMEKKSANFVVAVCEVDHSPLWANTLSEDCSMVEFIKPEIANMPRQNIPTYYRINGALYIIRTDYLVEARNLYAEKSFATIMDRQHSIDIDDAMDFQIAERLIENHSN